MSRIATLLRYYNTAQYIENSRSNTNHLCNAFITASRYFPEEFKARTDRYCFDWQDAFMDSPVEKHWHYCDICALGQDLNQIKQLLKEIQSCTSSN